MLDQRDWQSEVKAVSKGYDSWKATYTERHFVSKFWNCQRSATSRVWNIRWCLALWCKQCDSKTCASACSSSCTRGPCASSNTERMQWPDGQWYTL